MDQIGYFVGDFALEEVAYVGKFDALVALREPTFLALRRGREIGGVGQATAEQQWDLNPGQGLLVELRLLLDIGGCARVFP